MIKEELIKKVTLLANMELRKHVLFGHIQEWHKYILEAYEQIRKKK